MAPYKGKLKDGGYRWIAGDRLWHQFLHYPGISLGVQGHFRVYRCHRNLWKKKTERKESQMPVPDIFEFLNWFLHLQDLHTTQHRRLGIQAKNSFSTIRGKGGGLSLRECNGKINCHPFRIVLKSTEHRCVVINSTRKKSNSHPHPSLSTADEEIGYDKNNFINRCHLVVAMARWI